MPTCSWNDRVYERFQVSDIFKPLGHGDKPVSSVLANSPVHMIFQSAQTSANTGRSSGDWISACEDFKHLLGLTDSDPVSSLLDIEFTELMKTFGHQPPVKLRRSARLMASALVWCGGPPADFSHPAPPPPPLEMPATKAASPTTKPLGPKPRGPPAQAGV